jgi:hypothetical protein
MAHHLYADHITEEMRDGITRCSDCHNTCVETVTHSLTTGGELAAIEHIRLLLDCAQLCAASRDFMLRGSGHHARTCGLCAELCASYAERAEQYPGADEQLRRCAEECRRCAESCRRMAG